MLQPSLTLYLLTGAATIPYRDHRTSIMFTADKDKFNDLRMLDDGAVELNRRHHHSLRPFSDHLAPSNSLRAIATSSISISNQCCRTPYHLAVVAVINSDEETKLQIVVTVEDKDEAPHVAASIAHSSTIPLVPSLGDSFQAIITICRLSDWPPRVLSIIRTAVVDSPRFRHQAATANHCC
ncbi:unnamed protein product [Lactuca saligna]|uniref:Uncharacterized protein n=1 Tax=Lactuca saligna TaxID=75948 RepID=A0AA35Z6I9_LACSI|nr:unnamed protein product [Lactuca saligna]